MDDCDAAGNCRISLQPGIEQLEAWTGVNAADATGISWLRWPSSDSKNRVLETAIREVLKEDVIIAARGCRIAFERADTVPA